eukprot:jgi/Tetstr1/433462/TSEL_022734.t1
MALRLRAEVERVWGRMGLAKHPTKAHPEPTQQLQHLGLDLDLVTMQFRAPAAKLRRLSNLARDLMCIAARRRRHVPAKLLAYLAGQGQFLYLAMPPARFYLREAHTVMGRCSSPSGKTAYLHTDSSQYGWGTEAVDSLAQSDATWRAEVNWCNPPWQLLDDLVLKLQQSGAAATVVAPAWHGRPWLQQLHEMATESYGSEFNLFCEFCAQNGRLPDTADPPLIVRYISWVAARGRNKAGAFGPYLSVINAFFTDNFKEPPALGPFVNQAMRDWELAQQVLDAPDYRVPLPADVALACDRRAQRLVSHSITLYRRVLKGKPSGAPRPVLQISREAHPEIAELLEFFVTCRDHVLPGATRFWQLPDDNPGTWTAATVSEWVTAAALAFDATPPAGFCWSSHSLRSGGASAASATGVPMPTIRWLGGWKVGSGVVLNYIVPGILDSAGARYFFGSLAPQRSAANLS